MSVDISIRNQPSGKASLLYVLHNPGPVGIDVGGHELDCVKRLAKWYGVEIKTQALGYGGYRIWTERAA